MIDCDKCVWARRDGGCNVWECGFIDQTEAANAYNGVEQKTPESGSETCMNAESTHDRTTGDLIDKQAAIDAIRQLPLVEIMHDVMMIDKAEAMTELMMLPSAQPELIEKAAYIRGFEQGRTQGMIDTKAEEVAQPELATNLQQTCNQLATDCISRQAAIDEISKYASIWMEYDADMTQEEVAEAALNAAKRTLVHILEELPPAQPEQRWIPVTERLPEEYGEYQITWVTSFTPNKRLIGSAEYEITSEYDYDNGRFKGEWLLDDYIKNYPDVKVLAWMPLPSPYREEGE